MDTYLLLSYAIPLGLPLSVFLCPNSKVVSLPNVEQLHLHAELLKFFKLIVNMVCSHLCIVVTIDGASYHVDVDIFPINLILISINIRLVGFNLLDGLKLPS